VWARLRSPRKSAAGNRDFAAGQRRAGPHRVDLWNPVGLQLKFAKQIL
jgi:hypothetical protein